MAVGTHFIFPHPSSRPPVPGAFQLVKAGSEHTPSTDSDKNRDIRTWSLFHGLVVVSPVQVCAGQDSYANPRRCTSVLGSESQWEQVIKRCPVPNELW